MRVSPQPSAALGRPVRTESVPHETWETLFRTQGMRNPIPRIRMLDGLNEGWIDFPEQDARVLRGKTSATEVIAALVQQAAPASAV
jgi:hypothetical protein